MFGLLGFIRGGLGSAPTKNLTGDFPTKESWVDASRVSKRWELRQMDPESRCQRLGSACVKTLSRLHKSVAHRPFPPVHEKWKHGSEALSRKWDVAGSLQAEIREGLVRGIEGWKGGCGKACVQLLIKPRRRRWGQGFHQAELNAFDHLVPTWPSHGAQGRCWDPKAPPEVVSPQSRGTPG